MRLESLPRAVVAPFARKAILELAIAWKPYPPAVGRRGPLEALARSKDEVHRVAVIGEGRVDVRLDAVELGHLLWRAVRQVVGVGRVPLPADERRVGKAVGVGGDCLLVGRMPAVVGLEVAVEQVPCAVVVDLRRLVPLEPGDAGGLETGVGVQHGQRVGRHAADRPAEDVEQLDRVVDEVPGEPLDGRAVMVEALDLVHDEPPDGHGKLLAALSRQAAARKHGGDAAEVGPVRRGDMGRDNQHG